jgi:hypothetical protein
MNKPEVAVAAAIILFGLVMALIGSSYGVGTLQEMGTGYFPVLLGAVTVFFGVATLLEVRRSDSPPPEIPWRAFIFVFAAILVWSLLVERVGLFPSSVLLVILGSLGRTRLRMKSMVLTALIAAAASVLIFIEGFSLPLHAIAW